MQSLGECFQHGQGGDAVRVDENDDLRVGSRESKVRGSSEAEVASRIQVAHMGMCARQGTDPVRVGRVVDDNDRHPVDGIEKAG